MRPISPTMKAAFRDDSVRKFYGLQFLYDEDVPEDQRIEDITNEDITQESLHLVEPLCSEDQLKFGKCESSSIEFEMLNYYESMNGMLFDLYLVLEGCEEEEPFMVGRYAIDGETVSNDKKTTQITAYDNMYFLRDLDVTDWYYNEISFPMTIGQIRNSLFNYLGANQESINLINDNITIPSGPLDGENVITFAMIMEPICEVNGVFGHFGRDAIFHYVSLDVVDDEETYPSEDTYPSKNLYPKSIRGKYYNYPKDLCHSDMWWENYKCKPIDKVQARDKTGAAICEYSISGRESGTNIYVIQENWVLYELDVSTIQTLISRFAEKVKNITYTPCEIDVKMDLSMEVGDGITFTTTTNQLITTYILRREMNGIHSAVDSFESLGYEEYVNSSPNTDGAISELQDQITDLANQVSDIGQQYSNIRIISTRSLPSSPEKNVLYLIQGTVYVN